MSLLPAGPLLRASLLAALGASASAQAIDLEGRLLLQANPGAIWADRCNKFFDADADGDLDFAWGGDNTDYSYLGIRTQRGHGAFELAHSETFGLSYVIPSAIAAGNLDAVGAPEIVYATAENRAVVLARTAGGSYVVSLEFPIVSYYADMGIGDLDGDGDADVAGVHDASLRVHWNQAGTIGAPTVIPLSGSANALELSDLDGDGRLDAIVAIGAGGGSVAVVLGLGAGAFATPVAYPAGGPAQRLVVADFDLDGRSDVATSNGGAATVSVLLNAGQGLLTAPVTSPAGIPVVTIGAGDADGDGDPDLVLAGALNGGGLSVLLHSGAGTFASPAVYVTGWVRNAALTDLDGDGDLDIAMIDRDALRNRGDGTFAADAYGPTAQPIFRFATGDVDGDGDEDLLQSGYGNVRLRRNLGDGTLSDPVDVPGSSNGWFLQLADVEPDGDLDLLVNSQDPGSVRVLPNQSGSFGAPVTIAGQAGGGLVGIADVDGDALLDLVTKAGTGSGGFSVALNTGGATWSAFTAIAGANGIYPGWTVADVDGDGDPDLVSSTPAALRLHANLGGLVFASPVDVAPFGTLAPILAADLDADGDVDLAASGPDATHVLWNQGGGTFANPIALAARTGMLVAEDLDHDGDLDVLGAVGGSHVEVIENLGGSAFAPAAASGISSSLGVGTIDIDRDGDEDLFGHENLFANQSSRPFQLENRTRTGLALCSGDGSGTPCPCGNASAPGAAAGCVNSTGRAGTLRASGASSLRTDTLTLRGTGMTSSSALYFQGTTEVANGAGAGFGDGLRCVAGAVVRLGLRTNFAGASTFPGANDPALRVAGQVTAPGPRSYQVWYRDAAPFCTGATWSLTNALRVVWSL